MPTIADLDRLLEEAERSVARKAAALKAFEACTPSERRELFVQVYGQVRADVEARPHGAGPTQEAGPAGPTAEQPAPDPVPDEVPIGEDAAPTDASAEPGEGNPFSFVERAFAFVKKHHPAGVTTKQVAAAIGQAPASTDGTLRYLMRKKGRIEHRGGLWFAIVARMPFTPDAGPTIRTRIIELLRSRRKPMTAKEMFEVLAHAGIARSSIDAEISRMRKNELRQVGTGPHGAGRYSLVKGVEAET